MAVPCPPITLRRQICRSISACTHNMAARSSIGRAAAKLIYDGETLIVNGGSTTLAARRRPRLHGRG